MMAKTIKLNSNPGRTPKLSTSEIGSRCGRANHQSRCEVAITDPIQKNKSVTSIRALPPPTVYNVPDAQPPPSCMPIPKIKAPIMTDMETGLTLPLTGLPNNSPAPKAGKNSRTAKASIIICARKPRPRRSLIKTRQLEVKPNEAWYRVMPSAPPIKNNRA